jgi:hypothetical protein
MLVGLTEVLAIQGTGKRNLAFRAAADATDVGVEGGTGATGTALAASLAQNRFRHGMNTIIG